ncbi:hypothetical protein ACOJIU_14530 [Carnobacterium maltaromaticum]|uniref:hypothetical protein n=1 Tax=Carnobacterium maltaromaticum TaxID=2751 RepID=UPI003B980C76
MAMKEQDVLNHLEKYGFKGEFGKSIWAMPSYLLNGFNYINVNFRYQILNFSEDGVYVIDVGQATNKIVDVVPQLIPASALVSVTLKKGFLTNKAYISTIYGDISFKVMKNIMNKKWHKKNYENLQEKYPG